MRDSGPGWRRRVKADGAPVRPVDSVDGDEAVEEPVSEIEALLAVAERGLDAGIFAADFRGHVFAEFVGVVTGLLLGREGLVVEVFAEAGTDL